MGAVAVGRVRLGLVPIAALLLLAGTACGERSEPTGALVESYPVTVQGTGDATIVKSAPKRIVPVGVGPREILKSLGLDERTTTVDDALVGLPLVGAIRRAWTGRPVSSPMSPIAWTTSPTEPPGST